MKKTFTHPQAQEIAIQGVCNILAGSQNIVSGGSNGNGGPTNADARDYTPSGIDGGDPMMFEMN